MCRAVAAATSVTECSEIHTTSQAAFHCFASGEVDILSRNTTWTMTRDTQLGLNFAGVNYYDGQGMMVPTSLGDFSFELDGANIAQTPAQQPS